MKKLNTKYGFPPFLPSSPRFLLLGMYKVYENKKKQRNF